MKSSIIGDASFIGLECESGNIDDCNDGTDESAPPDCQGVFILSETESQCGSKCNNKIRGRRWWTLFTSQAIKIESSEWHNILVSNQNNPVNNFIYRNFKFILPSPIWIFWFLNELTYWEEQTYRDWTLRTKTILYSANWLTVDDLLS